MKLVLIYDCLFKKTIIKTESSDKKILSAIKEQTHWNHIEMYP